MSFAEVDAFAVGRITGQICFILLLLAGILKCITISKRPTTNSKCVWSLACFLAVFLVPAAMNLLPKESPVFAPLAILARMFWIGLCFAASIILAIIGLVECGRERGRFIQGRAQAIWALSLCGTFLIFSMTGAAVVLMRAQNFKNQSASRGLLAFKELNFQFSAPGRPWMQADEYVAKQFVGDLGELRDLKIEGLDEPDSPFVVNFTYLARRQFQILENEIAGSPPLNIERSFLIDQTVEKRTTPFQIPVPLTIEGSVTIHVPANFKSEPAGVAQNIQNQFISCRFSAMTNGTGWRLEYHIYEPSHRFAPEQYPAYNLAMRQVVNTLGPNLACVRQ